MSNHLGNEHNTFFISFYSNIFYINEKDLLAESRKQTLNSTIVSSSCIMRFSNFVDNNYNLDCLTLVVPSWAIYKISQTSFSEAHVLINWSTSLNIMLNVLEFLREVLSSAIVYSTSSLGETFSSSYDSWRSPSCDNRFPRYIVEWLQKGCHISLQYA